MPITTGQMRQELEGPIARELNGLLKDMQTVALYPQFMKVTKTNKYVERVQAYDNMREAQFIPEGSEAPQLDFREGWNQKFTQQQYGAAFSITDLTKMFARRDIIAAGVKQLRMSTYKTKEIIGTNYLVNGDQAITSVPKSNGQYLINPVGGDGNPLFYASHSWRNELGSDLTWSNRSATYYDPNELGVNAIMVLVAQWNDNTGAPMDIDLTRLIIPTPHAQLVYKLMKSTNEPQSNNNAVNSIPLLIKGGKDALVDKWLNSTSLGDGITWYAQTSADPDSYWLQWFTGKDDATRSYIDNATMNNVQEIRYVCATGANELRGLVKIPAVP